ncbi:MAG: DUF4350 domain-containing protein [Deltaproteobacteria bacterium]|nr:DUF4350 domain-containing protein [Deltaproteobacteria bacterium]
MTTRLRNPRIIVPALILLFGTLGTLWFLNNYERKSFEVQAGESPAARANQFLAAQGFLQALGKKVTDRKGMALFSELPPTGDTIILPHMPVGMSKHMTANLLSWIEGGGHLLLVPNGRTSNHPGTGDILKEIGVELHKEKGKDCGCPSEKKKKAESQTVSGAGQDEKKSPKITAEEMMEKLDSGYHPYDSLLDLTIDGFPIHLKYFNSTLLKDESKKAAYRIDGSYRKEYQEEADRQRKSHNKVVKKDGAWLLQYNIGAGKVTVLSEMWLFKNNSIGEYDHAFFLSWLVRDSEQVWLLYALSSDSLGSILWTHLPYFWISSAVLIVLAVWRMQKRSGGLLPPPLDNRRNILAHIDATGLYNWRMGKASAMIAENRKTILHRLARRQLGLSQDQEGENIGLSKLAAKTGFTEHELLIAFRSNVANEQDLIRTSQALQKIENLIQGGKHDR